MSYKTADQSVSSSIAWWQFYRDGSIEIEGIESEVKKDLESLGEMEIALREGEVAIDQNEELSDIGRRRKLSELVNREVSPILKHVQQRIEGLQRARKNAMKDVTEWEAPDSGDIRGALREREIRDFYQGKPAGEVLEAVKSAGENGDAEFLRALEDAPAVFDPEVHKRIREFRQARLENKYPEKMGKYHDQGVALEIYEVAQRELEGRLKAVAQGIS